MAMLFMSGVSRSLKGLSGTKNWPKLGPKALSTNDCPEMEMVWATPFSSWRILSTRFTTTLVRSSDVASGIWRLTSR